MLKENRQRQCNRWMVLGEWIAGQTCMRQKQARRGDASAEILVFQSQ